MGFHHEDTAPRGWRGGALSTETSYGPGFGLNSGVCSDLAAIKSFTDFPVILRALFLKEEAEFSGGAFGAEVVGEVEGRSGAGGYGGAGEKSTEGEEAGGLFEI